MAFFVGCGDGGQESSGTGGTTSAGGTAGGGGAGGMTSGGGAGGGARTGGSSGGGTTTGGGSGNRQLDLVVMIDNSASMAPKQAKLKAQFPKLIAALADPSTGLLPDLRVALIDSDLGTGGAYRSGTCGPKTLLDGTTSVFGDMGRFQMIDAQSCGVTGADALWLEYSKGQAVNYAGDINTVFTCLAGKLGTLGCGMEHQLQALDFALAAKGTGNETQQMMLRGSAYLGLVFLSDEDDCSAAPKDEMFGDIADLRGESASLRCATRGHACGGQNLNNSGPGYPTKASYTHAFSDCSARMGDECSSSTDTSVPTDCNPLKSISTLVNSIKGLKGDPNHQILVAGIFGWPLADADMAKAEYKIAHIPNPNTADTMHPTTYEYWPICYDPAHMPAASTTDSATGFDTTAAGWGATGGLRMSAFINEFGANGLKFSICQSDLSDSLTAIGNALVGKLASGK
jgi:hypothetical protein